MKNTTNHDLDADRAAYAEAAAEAASDLADAETDADARALIDDDAEVLSY